MACNLLNINRPSFGLVLTIGRRIGLGGTEAPGFVVCARTKHGVRIAAASTRAVHHSHLPSAAFDGPCTTRTLVLRPVA